MTERAPNAPHRTASDMFYITNESDAANAVMLCYCFCKKLPLNEVTASEITTAFSELASNIIKYAGSGHIELSGVETRLGQAGVEIIATDKGPGIADIELALKDSYSTGKSLGLGLPGVKRLMDEFSIESFAGKGTSITARRWL